MLFVDGQHNSFGMTTVASVIAVGLVILNDIRSRRVLHREPHVNREYCSNA
jgi:hypothetical protein